MFKGFFGNFPAQNLKSKIVTTQKKSIFRMSDKGFSSRVLAKFYTIIMNAYHRFVIVKIFLEVADGCTLPVEYRYNMIS